MENFGEEGHAGQDDAEVGDEDTHTAATASKKNWKPAPADRRMVDVLSAGRGYRVV
jgi:hypothetical protein